MTTVVLADKGLAFNGRSLRERPLGGAETAFVYLAEALAARGLQVVAYTANEVVDDYNGVQWLPLADGLPPAADAYIASRHYHLISAVPHARRAVFWSHNPAYYLGKPRFLWPLLRRRRMPIVVTGAYHQRTVPWLLRSRTQIIPYGIGLEHRAYPVSDMPPPPVAIFTSNPLRHLDWLLQVWQQYIIPQVANAELHIYAGGAVYNADPSTQARMDAVLATARATNGVRVFAPLPKPALLEKVALARVMVYRGDLGESFCLAVAEAQCLGRPCVVGDLGALPERVSDGVNGFVASTPEAFAAATVRLLTDDVLWRQQQQAALQQRDTYNWAHSAAQMAALLGV